MPTKAERVEECRELLQGLQAGTTLTADTPPSVAGYIRDFASGHTIEQIGASHALPATEIEDAIQRHLPCPISDVYSALDLVERADEDERLERDRARVLAPAVKSRFRQSELRDRSRSAIVQALTEFWESGEQRDESGFARWSAGRAVPSISDIEREFGSWGLGVVAAGFDPHRDVSLLPRIDGDDQRPMAGNESDRQPAGETAISRLAAWTMAGDVLLSDDVARVDDGALPDDAAQVDDVVQPDDEVDPDDVVQLKIVMPQPVDVGEEVSTNPESQIRLASSHIGHGMTREAYDDWAVTRGAPSSAGLERRTTMSWNALVRLAGIEADAEAIEPDGNDADPDARAAISANIAAIDLGDIIDSVPYSRAEVEWSMQSLHAIRTREAISREASVRDQLIVLGYANNETLQTVGDRFGVTRERVRQIVNKRSGLGTSKITDALRIETACYEARVELAESRAVRDWSEKNVGVPVSVAAQLFGMSEGDIRDRLGDRKKFHKKAKVVDAKRFSDAELLELVRRFHSETGSTVSSEFEDWSRAQGGPSRQTIMIRFDKWSTALEAAGVANSGEVSRSRAYTPRDCWACVIEYLRIPSSDFTYADFEKWTAQDEAKPSGATIRNRLQVSWSHLVEVGLKVLGGQETEYGARWAADVLRQRDWASRRGARKQTLDPIELVSQAYEELGSPLTNERYNAWADENGQPKSLTVTNTYGKRWNYLLLDAGIPLSPRQARTLPRDVRMSQLAAGSEVATGSQVVAGSEVAAGDSEDPISDSQDDSDSDTDA